MKKIVSCLLIVFFLLVPMMQSAFVAPSVGLKKGAKGDHVKELQEALSRLGYNVGVIDGDFGAKTENALKELQKNVGLDINGVLDRDTHSLLFPEPKSDDTADITKEEATINTEESEIVAQSSVADSLDSVYIAESESLLEIKEAGYVMNNGYLFYSVVLHNRSDKMAVEFPSFRITSRDANGSLLGTRDQVLNIIYPGQDYVWAGLAYSLDEIPTKVEFDIIEPDDFNITSASTLSNQTYIPLEVTGANKKDNDIWGCRFLGEIQNHNDYAIDQAAVIVVFRDAEGALLGGDLTFIDSIKAGTRVPFDLNIDKDMVSETYEIYAADWGYSH